jgi:hypothetical protein
MLIMMRVISSLLYYLNFCWLVFWGQRICGLYKAHIFYKRKIIWWNSFLLRKSLFIIRMRSFLWSTSSRIFSSIRFPVSCLYKWHCRTSSCGVHRFSFIFTFISISISNSSLYSGVISVESFLLETIINNFSSILLNYYFLYVIILILNVG